MIAATTLDPHQLHVLHVLHLQSLGITWTPARDTDGDGDYDHDVSGHASPPQPQQLPAVAPAPTVSTSPGSFRACVIARESGGNAQVMNSSGHYGLYQFSASTWAAYGGSPADFGHASAAEQTSVFNRAIAEGGAGNWSKWDGCTP